MLFNVIIKLLKQWTSDKWEFPQETHAWRRKSHQPEEELVSWEEISNSLNLLDHFTGWHWNPDSHRSVGGRCTRWRGQLRWDHPWPSIKTHFWNPQRHTWGFFLGSFVPLYNVASQNKPPFSSFLLVVWGQVVELDLGLRVWGAHLQVLSWTQT